MKRVFVCEVNITKVIIWGFMRLFIPSINAPTGYIIYVSAKPVPGILFLPASDSQGCLSLRHCSQRHATKKAFGCFSSNFYTNVGVRGRYKSPPLCFKLSQ